MLVSGHNQMPLDRNAQSLPASLPRQLVDPFIGTAPCDLPPPAGLAASWFWPKPQIGNTHPGSCIPFGMLSACPYTGGYPTGYGRYAKSLQGLPLPLFDELRISGFTHFQPSGVGAIRKYYNYCRVTPLTEAMGGLPAIGTTWPIDHESASPGYYTCRIPAGGIIAELTVGRRAAVHRYTFPASPLATLAIDFSHGGIAIEDGRTIPLRAEFQPAQPPHGRSLCDHGRAADPHCRGASRACTRLRSPAVVMATGCSTTTSSSTTTSVSHSLSHLASAFQGPTQAGDSVELQVAFSLRSRPQAWHNCRSTPPQFSVARSQADAAWDNALGKIEIEGGTRRPASDVFYGSLPQPDQALRSRQRVALLAVGRSLHLRLLDDVGHVQDAAPPGAHALS